MQINNIEDLMLQIMYKFADKFGEKAILKGGMDLRLLDCPRYTNDLDYVFSPFSSKKEIQKDVISALREIPNLEFEDSTNSKCIRIQCSHNEIKLQIEINVLENCASQELSTASLAQKNNQLVRIIRGMSFEVSLSHKLAAWNERRLIRDLYDCYFMASVLDISPNLETLQLRLSKIESRIKNLKKIKKLSLTEFTDILNIEAKRISQEMIEKELRDYLEPAQLPGLDLKIKYGLNKIIDSIKTNIE